MTTTVDAIDWYLAARVERGELHAETARRDGYILARLAELATTVEALDVVVLDRWARSVGGLAPSTRRKQYSRVKGFCRWLVARGLADTDPSRELGRVREPRRVPRGLTRQSVGALLAAADGARGRAIIGVMVQLGLRCCEVARLELADIDPDAAVVRIRGKADHERVLPLTDEAAELLQQWIVERGRAAGPVFGGITAYRVSVLVTGWCYEAGIKAGPRDGVGAHALRHTAATDMLRAGAHLRDVQAALGHAHLATTEIYLPTVVDGLAVAMAGRRYGDPEPAHAGHLTPRIGGAVCPSPASVAPSG